MTFAGSRNPIIGVTPVAGLPRLLGAGDGTTSGPLDAGEPHRDQAFMHYVSTDLALRGFDQLLDLLRERVDLRPFHRPAQWVATSVADRDIPGDGLLIHPDQLRGRVSAACQIESPGPQ